MATSNHAVNGLIESIQFDSTGTFDMGASGKRMRLRLEISASASVVIKARASADETWETISEEPFTATGTLNIYSYGFTSVRIEATIASGTVNAYLSPLN